MDKRWISTRVAKERMDNISGKAIGFVSWIHEQLDKVPAEHKALVDIEFEREWEYDCDYLVVTLSYSRLETDEETDARKAKEERARIKAEADGLVKKRALYGELKKQFETNN